MPPTKSRPSRKRKPSKSTSTKRPAKKPPSIVHVNAKPIRHQVIDSKQCVCIICGTGTSSSNSSLKLAPTLTPSSIESLCILLNLNCPEGKLFFGQSQLYCSRCRQIVVHVDSLVKMVQVEREHISSLLLETYGQVKLESLFSETQTNTYSQSRSRRTSTKPRKYEEFEEEINDEDDHENEDETYEPEFTNTKTENVDDNATSSGGGTEVTDYQSLFDTFVNFPDPVIVYDDENYDFTTDHTGDNGETGDYFDDEESGLTSSISANSTSLRKTVKRGKFGAFKCPECGIRTTRKYHLESHILRKHPNSSSLDGCQRKLVSYPCSICSENFRDRWYLKRHIDKEHPEDKLKSLTFSCQHCEQSYDTRKALNFHVKVHDPNIDKICHFCNFGYSRTDRYKKHMLKLHSPNFNCVENIRIVADEDEEVEIETDENVDQKILS